MSLELRDDRRELLGQGGGLGEHLQEHTAAGGNAPVAIIGPAEQALHHRIYHPVSRSGVEGQQLFCGRSRGNSGQVGNAANVENDAIFL